MRSCRCDCRWQLPWTRMKAAILARAAPAKSPLGRWRRARRLWCFLAAWMPWSRWCDGAAPPRPLRRRASLPRLVFLRPAAQTRQRSGRRSDAARSSVRARRRHRRLSGSSAGCRRSSSHCRCSRARAQRSTWPWAPRRAWCRGSSRCTTPPRTRSRARAPERSPRAARRRSRSSSSRASASCARSTRAAARSGGCACATAVAPSPWASSPRCSTKNPSARLCICSAVFKP
mmetsp:Transcript_2619/g.10446  ORF Transcript_2619/g.10446 Transcript_2619/m.10446 type:complete len:231 (-) Transcript_2619:24-716(-)